MVNGRLTLRNRDFWRRNVKKYDAKVFAKTERPHPRPPKVEHLFSSGLGPELERYWAFATEEDLDTARLAHPGKFTPLPVNPCP